MLLKESILIQFAAYVMTIKKSLVGLNKGEDFWPFTGNEHTGCF